MGERSAIEWCDHTFNPWWGCQRVSPGCQHCYAETFAKRTGHGVWGPAKTTPRRKLSEAYWQGPLKWNAQAEAEGRRARVFCASMADVFEDHPDVMEERARLWGLIEATPALDWLLLTKRPENVEAMVPASWEGAFPLNVWIGTSAEDQARWDERIPIIASLASAALVFVSAEPLLGPIENAHDLDAIEWVIVGGESGPGARPCDIAWVRSLVRQCRETGTASFVKQLGASWYEQLALVRPERDAKGGEWAEWPEDLRVREWPASPAEVCTMADAPTLYIAGPMTGLPEFNYPAFVQAREELQLAGYTVLCPTDNDADGDFSQTWEWYMRRALRQVLEADAVAVLPDAICSRGACLEIHVARSLGMEVMPLSAWLAAALGEVTP